MYLREPCYDINELVRENLHVHTTFSGCAKTEMRVKDIIRKAEEFGLERIALVDHFNDADAPIIEKNKADKYVAECYEAKVKILFGAELSAYGVGKWLDSDEVNSKLDYRLYAANHYHLDFWEHPEDKSPEGYAKHSFDVLSTLIKSGRADCIAHPVMAGYIRCFEDKNCVTNAMTDNQLGDLLTLARDNKTAWEINRDDALAFPEFSKRFWNLGKEIGVVFHFGSDAHTIQNMNPEVRIDELRALFD